jgi:hypothetical protein
MKSWPPERFRWPKSLPFARCRSRFDGPGRQPSEALERRPHYAQSSVTAPDLASAGRPRFLGRRDDQVGAKDGHPAVMGLPGWELGLINRRFRVQLPAGPLSAQRHYKRRSPADDSKNATGCPACSSSRRAIPRNRSLTQTLTLCPQSAAASENAFFSNDSRRI